VLLYPLGLMDCWGEVGAVSWIQEGFAPRKLDRTVPGGGLGIAATMAGTVVGGVLVCAPGMKPLAVAVSIAGANWST